MILSPDDLKGKTVKELRAITTDFHASWHPAEKADTLIARICELSSIVQPDQKNVIRPREDVAHITKPAPSVRLTKDEILEHLSASIECGLLLRFSDDGGP